MMLMLVDGRTMPEKMLREFHCSHQIPECFLQSLGPSLHWKLEWERKTSGWKSPQVWKLGENETGIN